MKTTAFLFLSLFLAIGSCMASEAKATTLVSTTVVINEVYGGAGCGTAGCSTYDRDFVELKNISGSPVNIGGWTVQYASATGTGTWTIAATIPAGTILRAGDTYLIGLATGAAGTGVNTLPTPNVSGTTAMSATTGKVALVSNTTALVGACLTGAPIVDLVGYGSAPNCAEGSPALGASTTASVARSGAGTDTDVNTADFTAGTPTPQPALQPTASGVTLDGKVTTSEGRAIPQVTVTLVDSTGGVQTFITSGFGYYSFEGLRSGETYTISVQSKSYRFNPSSRTITAMDSVHDLDFTAEP